jgi:hypothetical protein
MLRRFPVEIFDNILWTSLTTSGHVTKAPPLQIFKMNAHNTRTGALRFPTTLLFVTALL